MRLFRYTRAIAGAAVCALLVFTSASLHAQTNLALNGTATASTADLPASAAIDGNMNTRWASAAQTDPSHITVDLGQQYQLSSVRIHWEAANAATYEIRGSNNGSSWTTLATRTGGTFGNRTDNINVSGTYRYVRMHGISRSAGNSWGYSIWQFEIYGQLPPQSQSVTIQAEDYNSYHDNSAGNTGGAYRNDNVDIEVTTDVGGGYNVGWIEAGEWLQYNVQLGVGTYHVTARVASDMGGGNYAVLFNGNAVGSQNVGNTGGWQSWITQPIGHINVTSAGVHTIRVNINAGNFNLNWLHLDISGGGGPTPTPVDITNLGGTITTQFGGSPANEGIANLIDNNVNTKFLTFNASAWVRYQISAPYTVNRYTLTSANDFPARDPASWTLQGSNNGTSWTTIDSRTNQSFPSRFQTREFTFSNTNGYSYYRFNFNNTSGTILQLAEMQLFGTPGGDTGGPGPGPCTATPITPYIQVNGGAWQQTSSVSVNSGSSVQLGPQPIEAAGWTWSGCGTSGTSRTQTISPSSSCSATTTYTNSCGAQSTQSFSITVSSGPVDPGNPNLGTIVPLYNSSTQREPVIKFDRGDALVTRFSDRARDRHAKEDQFQSYDHWLSFYWEHRTASIEIVDYVAKGGSTVRMNVRTQWRLNDLEAENRWFYRGVGTVAEYCDNGTMNVINDLNYYKERSHNCREGRAIQIGDKLEFELSQFLHPSVPNGRAPYYGTTYLYIVGEGLVPWDVGGATPAGGIKDSVRIPNHAWLGGDTTIHADSSNEPHNRFMQMATNLAYDNGQPFVLGRRLLHTSFVSGIHDEHPHENPVFTQMQNLAGPRFINESCSNCHVRNGREVPRAVGQPLDKWVFQVGDANGNPHPQLGRVLQPRANSGAASEGTVSIASWSNVGGLRAPNYQFSGVTPQRFSARIAPQLVGIGLLEAIPESAILALADPNDSSGNGISGRPNRVVDPVTGQTRLGRFGWKAGKASVRHQVAGALNTDMGVRNSVFPNPDCGSAQSGCGPSGSQLSDVHLTNLVKYISLLGVPPQREYNNAQVQNGKTLFSNIGCAGCHTPTFQTSAHHPLAELRNQTIHPYSDMLLHDMGPGLADNLGEGEATGSEWRTTPLWGLGHSACVVGGATNAGQGQRQCIPQHGYLHDGRARTIEEAILWHGGEGEASKNAYQALSAGQKENVLRFLRSL